MANTVYDNKIIEAKAKDLLTTAINTRSLMTVDTSLAETAGMTKTINVYTYTGEAEALEAGEGNSVRGAISFVGNDYKVQRVQANFDYTDDDFMKDNTVVDNGVAGATAILKNKMTDLEVKKFLKQISSFTSTFVEDETISSSQNEMQDALAGN